MSPCIQNYNVPLVIDQQPSRITVATLGDINVLKNYIIEEKILYLNVFFIVVKHDIIECSVNLAKLGASVNLLVIM